ncbi:MAG: hypothetical protein HQK50_08190 [Oligoflexia bacterium]|nr:hypothetical protein [Oligoflexia bacterium]
MMNAFSILIRILPVITLAYGLYNNADSFQSLFNTSGMIYTQFQLSNVAKQVATQLQYYQEEQSKAETPPTTEEVKSKIQEIVDGISAKKAVDAWGTPFVVSVNFERGEISIASLGPDKTANTGDDVPSSLQFQLPSESEAPSTEAQMGDGSQEQDLENPSSEDATVAHDDPYATTSRPTRQHSVQAAPRPPRTAPPRRRCLRLLR